jgi:hypothetical protein
MRGAISFLALALLSIHARAADTVLAAREGNIFLSRDGVEKQLTSSGRDSDPILAPDGKWVMFVREIDGELIATGSSAEGEPPAELWQIGVNGKDPSRLIRTRADADPKKLIAAFQNIQFSADGRLVYFVTPAWATSGAVHVVDTTSGRERFVMPGNELEVIHSGEYRDHFLVNQHRYFLGPGSYDWFWLFRPDGTEVGPVGEETEDFKSLQVK